MDHSKEYNRKIAFLDTKAKPYNDVIQMQDCRERKHDKFRPFSFSTCPMFCRSCGTIRCCTHRRLQ